MRTKFFKGLLISLTSCLALTGLIIAQTYMVFVASDTIGSNDYNLTGEVGLRKYFDSGTGEETDPYIITRPSHMYNLSKLQNLGAFSSKKYFQLGKLTTVDNVTAYRMYGNDTSSALDKTFLDMTPYQDSFLSIGSTATPFYGIFNGNSLYINNLKITSEPEDIGVFGYISSGAAVENINFRDLVITDKGYSNALAKFYDTDNLTAINNISGLLSFNTASIDNTGVSRPISVASTDEYRLAMDSSLINFAADEGTITNDSNVNFETSGNVKITIRSTNSDLFILSDDGSSMTLNNSLLASNDDFLSKNCAVYARIYLTGSVTINNAKYAKVLSTYTVAISNDISSGSAVQTFKIVKDPDSTYSYSHKTNIGFLAGHADGSVQSCYIYRGSFDLNASASSFTKQAAESEIGLVGEVGININNTISPAINYENAGDTGIINFTNIYKNIRGTDTSGNPSIAADGPYYALNGSGVTTEFYYFTPASTNLYSEYLRTRHVGTVDQELTATVNSVDFKGRQAIVEDSSNSRGLGIFQLNTADADTTDNSNQFLNGLGEFSIQYDSSRVFGDIYYTTAELDATLKGTTNPTSFFGSSKITNWTPGSANDKYSITYGTSMPSGAYSSAFLSSTIVNPLESSAFERNYDYIFKIPLANLNTNYFSGTNSSFIKEYFSYKLRDKNNKQIPSTSADFGIMVKELLNGSYTNTTSFSSYLAVNANTDGSTITYTDTSGASKTGPAKSIQFSVKNDNGANVTVIASNENKDNDYVCVYDMNYFSNTNTYLYPSYSMFLPYYKTEDETYKNTAPYFTYDNNTRNFTSVNANIDADNSTNVRLYAHTFYLPKGEYYIGSPDSTAKIYYVAAQGQNGKGNLGSQTPLYINADIIENLDFLLYDPEQSGKSLAESRAYVNFLAQFDATSGLLDINVNASNELTIDYDSNLSSALIQNTTNKNIILNGTAYNTSYIKINYD